MNKRELPLILLEVLQPYLNDRNKVFTIVEIPNAICAFKDSCEDSKFLFVIKSIREQNNNMTLDVHLCPISDENTGIGQFGLPINEFDTWFSKWLERIKRYNELKFVEDPILDSYQEFYWSEFNVAEDLDNDKPLKPRQILILSEHLSEIVNHIDEYRTPDNEVIISSIIQESNSLSKEITSITKSEVIKKLTAIWAKITKSGVTIFKEFLSEAEKEIITKGVHYLANHSVEIINNVIHLKS